MRRMQVETGKIGGGNTGVADQNASNGARPLRILLVTIGIVIADQITKLLVKGFAIPALGIVHDGYPIGTSFSIIGDFVRLTYIENPGMAFGIDFGGKMFLTLFSIAASIGIFLYLLRIRDGSFIVRLSLAMILGGALGNLIDRVFYGVLYGQAPLFYGKVVDFIDVDFFNIDVLGYSITRWPVFNIADASVSLGVVLLLFFHRRFASTGDAVTSVKSLDAEANSLVDKPVKAAVEHSDGNPSPP